MYTRSSEILSSFGLSPNFSLLKKTNFVILQYLKVLLSASATYPHIYEYYLYQTLGFQIDHRNHLIYLAPHFKELGPETLTLWNQLRNDELINPWSQSPTTGEKVLEHRWTDTTWGCQTVRRPTILADFWFNTRNTPGIQFLSSDIL